MRRKKNINTIFSSADAFTKSANVFSLIESVSCNAMYWLVWQLFWASAPPPPPPPPPPPQPPPVPLKFRHKIEEKSVNQSKLYIFSRLRIQTIFGLRCLSEYKYNFIRARPGPDLAFLLFIPHVSHLLRI